MPTTTTTTSELRAHEYVRELRGKRRIEMRHTLTPRTSRLLDIQGFDTVEVRELAHARASAPRPARYRMLRWSVSKPSVLIPQSLPASVHVTRRNKAWVMDMTYSDVARLTLPGRRDGSVLAQDRGLVSRADNSP
jgi:hypothetical protein